jgi:tetratricopeptide (TPR) repeat protein
MGDLWLRCCRATDTISISSAATSAEVAAEDVKGRIRGEAPTDAALHDDVALLDLELGRKDEAIAHFKASRALTPQSAVAHYNLGTALTVARRLDEAASAYREALRIDPAYANAHNNLGNVLLAQRQFDAAIREFEEVVRLQPDSASARNNLAAAYAAAGRQPPR